MTIRKTIKVKAKINTDIRRTINLDKEIYSRDINNYQFLLSISQHGQLIHLSNKQLVLVIRQEDTEDILFDKFMATEEDTVLQFYFTNDILVKQGLVTCHLYLLEDDQFSTQTDVCSFTFIYRISELDKSDKLIDSLHQYQRLAINERTYTKYIDYDVKYVNDDTLYVGQEVVDTDGVTGVIEVVERDGIEVSRTTVTEKVDEVIRVGTKLYEHVAYANITKHEQINSSHFLVDFVNVTNQQTGTAQILESENKNLNNSVAYNSVDGLSAGTYEVSVKVKKLTDEKTDIKFGFENINQTKEFTDISSDMTEYSFVATISDSDVTTQYYHFRTNGSVALEYIKIRKVDITDLSITDSEQAFVGVALSDKNTIALDYNNYIWTRR